MTEMPAPGATVDVFVLAAGRGSRLGSHGAETPKWLLEIGGETLADRHLAALGLIESEASYRVHVVTGHAAEEVESYLEGRDGPRPATLHNPEFDGLNNWYSVLLALRAAGPRGAQRVVIVNSDLFADPLWFARFLEAAASTDAESLIAVDLERELTDESMKVGAADEDSARLTRIGKRGVDAAVGEYVGLLMARGSVLDRFRESLEGFVGRDAHRDEWYERAVGLTAAEGVPWTIWPTPDGRWVEIDDEADLAAARELAGEPAR